MDDKTDPGSITDQERAKLQIPNPSASLQLNSEHVREKGPELRDRLARVFVEHILEHQPGQVLPFTNAHLLFTELLKRRELEPVNRNQFKAMATPLIRERFELGLRNDLLGPLDKQICGWKDLRSLDLDVLGRN